LIVSFPWEYEKIIEKINSIDPVKYASSRNYIDGNVTALSPYIARGVISTKQVLEFIVGLGLKQYQITKFVQELAWRDYFQNIYIQKKVSMFGDLKQAQGFVKHHLFPKSILKGNIGIPSLNRELLDFYKCGYLHNHVRMYLASIICNIAGAHWYLPSKWMYYHLLDADIASNTCSWQWVAGAFSSKKYYANQENINRYLHSSDSETYLDKSYEELNSLDEVPKVLSEVVGLESLGLLTDLNEWKNDLFQRENVNEFQSYTEELNLNLNSETNSSVFIHDFYNLDPNWHKEEEGARILLLEPSHFERFPISPKTLDFVWSLAKNIPNIQLFIGEFSSLKAKLPPNVQIYFKEHPSHPHYIGNEEARDWMFPEVSGYFPSFFTFWKKIEKRYF
jgi:deoxyribodipyrimidine photo-lyase